jgi:hypothetical protein
MVTLRCDKLMRRNLNTHHKSPERAYNMLAIQELLGYD